MGASRELDAALRKACSDAGLRPVPSMTVTNLLAALARAGVECRVVDGCLEMYAGTTELIPTKALKNFAQRPEVQNAELFMVKGSHPKDWTLSEKTSFIAKHGEAKFRELFQTPAGSADVKTLDANMSAADYATLTMKEKILFINTYGPSAVSRVMANKAAK